MSIKGGLTGNKWKIRVTHLNNIWGIKQRSEPESDKLFGIFIISAKKKITNETEKKIGRHRYGRGTAKYSKNIA